MDFLIADDHPILRVGLRQLIAAEWPEAHIAEADTLDAAVQACRVRTPDAVVLDVVMPDTSGDEGVLRMLRLVKKTPILVLSANDEGAFAGRLLSMGVAGYLPKDRAAAELVTALHRITRGGRYVTADMADRLLDVLRGDRPPEAPHEQLSAQEVRVMLLIASGKSPAQIAESMHLSVKTVGCYRTRIFDKLGWTNNIELTKYCIRHRLVEVV